MKKPLLILCTVILLPLAGCNLRKDDVKIATSNKNHTEGFSNINQNEWEFVSGNMQSPIDIVDNEAIRYKGVSIELI